MEETEYADLAQWASELIDNYEAGCVISSFGGEASYRPFGSDEHRDFKPVNRPSTWKHIGYELGKLQGEIK